MNKEDVIRMAREAGYAVQNFDGDDEVMDGDNYHIQTDKIERFAALVAAHEREECAQMLERTDLSALKNDIGLQVWFGKMFMGFAEAIRARGEK